MKRLLLIAALVAVLLTGCASPSGGSPSGPAGTSGDSGVRGRTLVDGGCPMAREASNCPDKPLSARLIITRSGEAAQVAAVTSDADGYFRVALPPGRYTVNPSNLTGGLHPAAGPQDISVQPHQYTAVTISFDSGVR